MMHESACLHGEKPADPSSCKHLRRETAADDPYFVIVLRSTTNNGVIDWHRPRIAR